MDNVLVSRYQFKKTLLFHSEGKVAIFLEFSRKISQQQATLHIFALAFTEHDLTTISSYSADMMRAKQDVNKT